MTVDFHAHWIPPGLAKLLRQRRSAPRIERVDDGERFVTYQGGGRPFDAALGDIDFRRELMKRHGVSKQVLSLAGLFGVDCLPLIHPGPLAPMPEVNLRLDREDNAWQRRIVLETQAVLSSVMMTLNLTSYLDPYPAVTVQVANLGGTIPFLVERMDEVRRQEKAGEEMPSKRMRRCYVDTASFGPRALELAVSCFGADRVVLGTDCPIFDVGRMLDAITRSRISPEARDLIMAGNARSPITSGASSGPSTSRTAISRRSRCLPDDCLLKPYDVTLPWKDGTPEAALKGVVAA